MRGVIYVYGAWRDHSESLGTVATEAPVSPAPHMISVIYLYGPSRITVSPLVQKPEKGLFLQIYMSVIYVYGA
jgi:hypothetical protein